jgi:putative ABC transport system permease protein
MDNGSVEVYLPASVVTVNGPTRIAGVASPSAFASLGYSKKRIALLVDPAVRRLTPADEQRLSGPVRKTTPKVTVTLERGYQQDQDWALEVFAIAASVIVLGATFAATGLAATDSRPDLETLSAIGSRPGTRRLVVAGQAAVIAAVGVPAGLMAGLVPGIAMVAYFVIDFPSIVALNGYRFPRPGIDIPWPLLGAGAIGLPPVAALVAGLFARTRVRLSRRS